MKAVEKRALEARRASLERVLARIEKLGPASFDPVDLDDFGYAKDYLIGWIDRIDTELKGGGAK
jgi:hypothetical protein